VDTACRHPLDRHGLAAIAKNVANRTALTLLEAWSTTTAAPAKGARLQRLSGASTGQIRLSKLGLTKLNCRGAVSSRIIAPAMPRCVPRDQQTA
jgi:hypothetical protein